MAADTDGNDGLTVADPEEFNQTQRLKAINEARERVKETIEASMARVVGDDEFTEGDRQQVVRATMYSYLTDIEWAMVEANEVGLLREQELGQVVIPPPERFVELADSDSGDYPRVIGAADLSPYVVEINGIQNYLAAPDVFQHTWRLRIEERHDRPETLTEKRQSYMPVHISKNAFRIANRFLNEAGADINLQEDDADAGFDYSDILDEDPESGAPPQIEADGGETTE